MANISNLSPVRSGKDPSKPSCAICRNYDLIDFCEMKLFSNFADRTYFDVDRLIDSTGTSLPHRRFAFLAL